MAQTFFVEEKVAERYRLDGIITVVDCYHISKVSGGSLVLTACV